MLELVCFKWIINGKQMWLWVTPRRTSSWFVDTEESHPLETANAIKVGARELPPNCEIHPMLSHDPIQTRVSDLADRGGGAFGTLLGGGGSCGFARYKAIQSQLPSTTKSVKYWTGSRQVRKTCHQPIWTQRKWLLSRRCRYISNIISGRTDSATPPSSAYSTLSLLLHLNPRNTLPVFFLLPPHE